MEIRGSQDGVVLTVTKKARCYIYYSCR